MAYLEDTPEAASEENEVQLGEDIGEEVEVFAKFLDECIVARGSASEQRARIFQLVDQYYGYARETADVLRERVRLARLARGGSTSSGDSNSNSNSNSNDHRIARPARRPEATATATATATADSAQRWEEEAQTWDLLRRLLPLRYRDKKSAAAATAATADISRQAPRSRKEYWADFVLTEPKARERKTILEWLQASAASSGADIDEVVAELQQNAERGEIVAHGWLHTRGAIKQHKRLLATADAVDPDSSDVADSNLDAPRKLVTQLDPDVVTRQAGRALAPQDAFFEQAIWRGCYELLRRGKSMAEIRDWCVERTEVWRAATISALPLGGGGGDGGDDDDVADFDCLATVLWRRMCYRLSQEAGTSTSPADVYQRAVYGALAGDVASVAAVGSTWDDAMFARYNAELRAQFDAYLMRQCDAGAVHAILLQHGAVPTAGSYGDHQRTRGGGSNSNSKGAAVATTPAKALQAAVIDERLDAYLFQQGVLLADYANKETESKLIPKYDGSSALAVTSTGTGAAGTTAAAAAAAADSKYVAPTDCHGLRILAHVLIVVSALDRLDGKGKDVAALGPLARRHQTEEHAIASYISFLRLARLEELVPLYASKLLGDRCYSNMALNLIHVDDRDMQVRLLQLMRKLGLDTTKFVRTLPPLFLGEVVAQQKQQEGAYVFDALQDGPPTLKFGRPIKTGIFGSGVAEDDEEEAGDDVMVVDKGDELLIRAMEWMMLVDGLVLDMCDFGVRIYKHLLLHGHLTAARVLVARVSSAEIVRHKTRFGGDISEEADPAWWDDVFGSAAAAAAAARSNLNADAVMMDDDNNDTDNNDDVAKHQIAAHARPLFELECLVNALDCLETTGVLAAAMAGHGADASRDRQVAKSMDDNAKYMRGFMKCLLKGWLLHAVDDPAYTQLRQMYLPQVIIGFASTLQFAGTTSSRDYMLECMELAAAVAAPDSDVAGVLVATGRMRELVESFASCSKALAIWTSDVKKGPGASSKKTRELGWSRELWSIK